MQDFIKARLNKDNFWNLMFFITFFLGLSLGYTIPQPFGGIIFWLTFIGTILLVKYNSPLTFDKEKSEFTTSRGNKIKKSGLGFIFLMIISFFLSVGVMSLFPDINFEESLLDRILLSFVFPLFPSLYCILRNFPIAVYFKKEAWTVEDSTETCNSSYYRSNNPHHFSTTESFMHPSNAYRDPRNSFLQGNIYHRK